MRLMERVSQQMDADLDLLLRRVDDPRLTIFQLICDMEESIVDLRRETVAAVDRQNRLCKGLFAAEKRARDIERQARVALRAGEELQARHILAREIGTLKERDDLEVELRDASAQAAEMVAALIRLQDRVQLSRRKRDELVGRRQAAPIDRHDERAAGSPKAGIFTEATRRGPTDSAGRIGSGRRRHVEGGGGC